MTQTILVATIEVSPADLQRIPAGRRVHLAGLQSLVPGWTLDEAEQHLRAGLDADLWFVYRGGSHIAIHYRPLPDLDRVLFIAERRVEGGR